jgi:hypothetical protein
MRAIIATEGGLACFPGLMKPVTIDTGELAPADAARLAELVEAARFFEQPARCGQVGTRGAADLQQHEVTIELEGRRHSVTVAEPIADPALCELVRFLQQKARAALRARARGAAPR